MVNQETMIIGPGGLSIQAALHNQGTVSCPGPSIDTSPNQGTISIANTGIITASGSGGLAQIDSAQGFDNDNTIAVANGTLPE